jgi:tRNA pseudouridine55 synthase
MNGLVLIDKPAGPTSHDIVNVWRRLAGTKRVGHLGTLDPMATGLLILVTGTATRLAQFFGNEEKTYEAEIRFGLVSNTYDAEGQTVETGLRAPEDIACLEAALEPFRGRFEQTPPPISAKKVKGVPAYKLARKQVSFDLQPVEVEVKRLELCRVLPQAIEIEVTVSSGTYVRSIAHDLGQRLGCGAILSRLRRVRVGAFEVANAKTPDELSDLATAGQLKDAVIPSAEVLPHFPAEHFEAAVEAQIRQGRDFRTSPFVVPPGAPFVRALSRSGDLIAIGEMKIPNLYHPSNVL